MTVGAFRAYFRLTNFQADEDPEAQWTIQSNIEDLQGMEQIGQQPRANSQKLIKNGLLFIERNGKIYNAQGMEVK